MMLNPVIKLTVLLLFLHSMAIAQSDTTYFDANWEKTSKENASYFRPKPVKVDDNHYLVKDYYMSNNKLQMEAVCLDDSVNTPNGIVTYYHNNGNISEVANYKDGVYKGWRKLYSYAGKLRVESKYKNGLRNGTLTVYDTLTGNIEYKGIYYNGQADGWCTWYYTDGKSEKRKVKYRYGNFKEGVCYTLTGEDTTFYVDSTFRIWSNDFPTFPGGDDMFSNFVINNRHYIEACKNYKGKEAVVCVRTSFDEYGLVYSTELVEGKALANTFTDNKALQQAALKMVKDLPPFTPAYSPQGIPIKADKDLMIVFY